VSRTAAAASSIAAASWAAPTGTTGGLNPSPGPSSRINAWKCTTARRWNSATLTNDNRHRAFSSDGRSPVRRASTRRSVIVKRRHSSGACQLNATCAG